MNRDKETYGIASIFIREHREDAVIHAAMRADALLDAGDLDGQRVWLRVIEAIKVLSNVDRLPKGEIHRFRSSGAYSCPAANGRRDA